MFESIVANLLNRFLGAYIENFDPKQLNIGIWSGDVKLKNLRLRKESLDKFKLPLDVKFGHIGELTLQIPWSNLKSKPVKVIIEDVFLLALPIVLQDYDVEEEKSREVKVKKQKLDDLEAILTATGQNQQLGDAASNESFTESLVTKIVDNLQVTIKNIHVRYEDDSILTEEPYSLGITLNELSAVSTDDDWVPSFISITQALTRKLILLKKLSCYMNTDTGSIFTTDSEKLLENFKISIADAKPVDIQYLLKPVSGEGRLTVHKAGATESAPHVKAEILFDEFSIDLDSKQYKDILWTASKFHWFVKTQKFRKFRPKVSVEEDPKEWFRYTARSILNEIHEKHYKWSWEYFATRRDQRKAYVELWKNKLLHKAWSADQQHEFDQLEIDLPFEDIKFYRSLARSDVRKQNLATSALAPAANAQSGWFSWWGASQPESKEEEELQLNDEQRKALYDAIEYDEHDASQDIDVPRDRVKFEVLGTLKRGGISIRRDKNASDLAQVVFEGCTTQIYQRPDSILAKFQLQEFRVEDGTSTTLYKHIVSVKQSHSHGEEQSDDPFFKISFEHNPLDQSADSVLLGKLKSMTIFYNPNFVLEIVKFFKPPKVHLDTVGAIMNAAEATMEGLTTQTRIGLQYALEEHKTVNVKLDLQAPLIILPLDPSSWKSPVAILDAGHISVMSELANKGSYEEIRSKESYSEEDWNRLNTLMYDRFNLHLQDAQFLVGPNIKDTMEQLHMSSHEQSATILDKFNVKLSLGISILPDATNLARIKIGGEVPEVKLSLNDSQYKTIMQIIDVAIPQFGDGDGDDMSVFNTFGNNSSESIELGEEDETKVVKTTNGQHMFEFDFTVGIVHLSLLRCIDGVTLEAEPLVDLIGDSLALSFYKTENDMHLDLFLKDMSLLDHIEKSGVPEFEKLVSSNIDLRENKHLFKLDYLRTQRIVEFNNKEIEVFDQDILLDIATVKFVVSRKSLLSLLNFVLNTFTDPNAVATPADELKHNDADDELAPQKINVDVNLESIIVVLNEDGIKLATLQLSTANVKVFLVPEAMDISGILGALSLHDETNHGSPRDSMLRNLISIEGDNLAEFKYKTFDNETNTQEFNSLVEFKTGSTTINFVEDAYSKIFNYLNQFLRMKAVYDRAREAAINQANQIDNANKIKFDFLVKAPTIIFPTAVDPANDKYDTVTAKLGELYAHNEFSEGVNKISTGIRNISVLSQLHFDKVVQNAELLNNIDIDFKVDYLEEFVESKPSITVDGKMPELDMHLTELQLQYLLKLSNSVTKVFSVSEESLEDVEEEAQNANAVVKHNTEARTPPREEKEVEKVEAKVSEGMKMVLKFFIPRISLCVYNRTEDLADFTDRAITLLAINNFGVDFEMSEDTHFTSDVSISSFVVTDARSGNANKFKEIIPLIDGDKAQFVLSASSHGDAAKKNITVMLTVESPRTIVALDYLFELQNFASKGLETNEPVIEEEDEVKVEKSVDSDVEPSRIGFSVNITNPTMMLLADPTDAATEAIVFRVEQVLLTSQNVTSVAANKIGMFLSTMNDSDDRKLRIIDDFSVLFAHDSRGSTIDKFMTNIQLSVEPLLVRVSLRDIRLALSIINRANELYAAQTERNATQESDYVFSEEFKRRLSQYAPTIRSTVSEPEQIESTKVVIKAEEFFASIGGVRFVLIGDVHELPVLDMNVRPFEAKAINWSTDLSAEAHIELFVNIYNYARSSWEPLVESWPIAMYASRDTGPNKKLTIDVVSRELAQVSVSSRSIVLLSQVFSSITAEPESKSREEATPYRIVNETGHDIEVWIDTDELSVKEVKNSQSIPWAFEDWRKIRENLDTDNKNDKLGVRLKNSPYKDIRGIKAVGEGEDIFMLYPPVEGVHNRLSCEITLGDDNVKTIWLKSTVKIDNDADIAVAIQITSPEGDVSEIEVKSKTCSSLPIDCVYRSQLKIKPAIKTSYAWSDTSVNWKDLLQGGLPFKCAAADNNSHFYFQAEAVYDPDEPLGKIYPHMSLVISAPVEVENLLPFDINYRLYDKSSRKDWSGSIAKGVKNYVHVVSLQSLLLLSVEPKGCGFGKSEFAIINTDRKSEFRREKTMTLKNETGQILRLKIHYPRKKNDSTSLKVVIYSPYLILNRTGQNLVINEKGNSLVSQGKASDLQPIVPNMFSFEKDGDRRNRALLQIGDSTWSEPLSFDAIGQATSTKAQLSGKQTEMNVGISIAEGEGKYNLTKVVTFAPRYILKNNIGDTLEIVENGLTKSFVLESKQLLPLYNLRRTTKKSLMMKFAGSGSWSSPFTIDDIGQVFLKVYKEKVGQILLKVNILSENGTVFIQVENANNNWPFLIRNFSDSDFYIYQADPNVNENGDAVKLDTNYKPIFYRVPSKSVMPYAYDYPNAVIKELIIRSHGRERSVNLSEIGNLRPFRLPATEDAEQAIVDLHVVADGPTQSLVISNYDPSVSLYKLQGPKSSSSTQNLLQQKFETTEEDENYHTKIITRFEGFGISLINSRGQELCYTTLRGIEIRYNESDLYQNISVKLKWIQVDNQLYGSIFPIVIYPSVVPKSGKEMNNHPSFSGSVCKVKDDSHGVLFIKYATILLQEMTFEIDEDFLFALLDFAKLPGASWNKVSQDKLCDDQLHLPEPKRLSESSDIYFEALHLQPTITNLSFVRTERINAEDRQLSQNTLMFFFNVLTMAIGNINDAPIKLNALFIENIRVPIPVLMESILTHYGQSFFYQVHKILGSADFLGNPVGLFNNISSGVLDIFYEPYQGFVINDRPQELGIGIAKGGLSFLKKTIFGFSDSFTKFTGSIAKGLSVATMDEKFQERRRNHRRNKPKHALYGFASGANSFFESISSGVTGIATNPLEGANEGGASGFFRGLGKGVVGLPTKTAIGFFDLASSVSEGIRNTTTVFDAEGLDKVRLPRYIGHDMVVRPYSQREAQGQLWLKTMDDGSFFQEQYLAHLILSGEETAIIITFKKIIMLEINTLKTKWQVPLEQVKSISVEPTGISIKLKRREGPFVPVPERQNRSFLYNKIAVAVEEFNKHCQVEL